MMKEEVIRKYVRDLDGLLKDVDEWEEPEIYKVTHDMVVFLFGRIFRFLNFASILIGHDVLGDLDALAFRENGELQDTIIEFEVRSRTFKRQKHDENRCNLIVCWKHNWEDCPSNIDVLELKYFWEKAGV